MAIVLDGSVGISSIGTLTGVTSISSTTADTPVILQDSSSNSNTCRAWVNFNGTSTVAIRADFNVSSITDNGTGDYTVNFTTAMPDANFSSCGLIGRNPDGTGGNRASFCYIDRYSTTTCRIVAQDVAATLLDPPSVFAAIFR
jgi:hypothetical protein